MKFKLNRAFREASGELDGLIYRNVRGKVVASPKPAVNNDELSPAQQEHRIRFRRAVAYGRSAMADENARLRYDAIAAEKNIPVFAAVMADFFNVPTIEYVDDLGYHGNIGDVINILASDDCGVVKVHVSITDGQETPIENGEAFETSDGSGEWVYAATASVASSANIQVVATDRPGGTAVKHVTRTF